MIDVGKQVKHLRKRVVRKKSNNYNITFIKGQFWANIYLIKYLGN
jgi:hypothetical protein